MIIDHLGIVVKSIEDGIVYWREVFKYNQMTDIVINSTENVRVVFLNKKNSVIIKLIEPMNNKSAVYAFAKKGGGLHHLCFRCDDIEKQIDTLKDKGLRVVVKPTPGEAFLNNNIAFLLGQNRLTIELIDTSEKAAVINTPNLSAVL